MNDPVSSAEVDKLASACYAIVDEIEKLSGHSAILGDMRGQVTSLRQRSDPRRLTLLLKELVQWVATLPKATQDVVAGQLSAKGLSHFLRIDAERVKRVMRRGVISTASECRAVKEYINNPPEYEGTTESLDKLAAMLADFDVRKRQSK
jgi:hypothetical protein